MTTVHAYKQQKFPGEHVTNVLHVAADFKEIYLEVLIGFVDTTHYVEHD